MKEAPAPIPLQELLRVTPPLTVEQVRERLAPWVLVGEPPGDEEGGWSYHTSRRIQVRDARGVPMLFRADYIALPVAKVVAIAPDMVLVGRARSNDVCIEHASVSKLHARIRLDDEGRPVAISDAGSANGTTVEEEPVEADAWVELAADTELAFGEREFTLISAERLVEVLQGL
jgi:hypothetical protein